MLSITLQPGPLQRALSVGWMRWLGKISFGIYVYHVFLASLYDTIAEHLAGPGHRLRYLVLRAVVAAILTPIIAWLSYEWLERPWLRLKDRFAPRTASTARKLEAVFEKRSPNDLDRAAV
jgi:peptidoglycan/LPS O-acetylase OafA/YrhL